MSTPHLPAIADGAYWIRNKHYGTVLSTGPTKSGAVILAGQDKHTSRQDLRDHSQIWLIEKLSDGVTFRIRNAQSGFVLDVCGSSTANGAWVIIYGQTGNPNQHWAFERVSDANKTLYYRIVNVYTRKVLDQTAGAGNPVESWAWNGGQHQQWSLEPVILPVYWITHAQTGWHLQNDPTKGVIAANEQPSTAPNRSQLWFLESQKDSDAYVIRNLEDHTKVLDLCGSGTADGTPVLTYGYHGGPNQQWKIMDVDQTNPNEDRVRIVSVLAGTVVQVIKGSTYGTLQARTNKNDCTQSWRLKVYPYRNLQGSHSRP
ncbi:ricin B-like lectin [Choiromyces venosus 120613-1]|uniref:Ricin B-like lectin n=1 Tax=Choiromyces venosus 120613-1 TaxID=1336337 RepID=A0A3N4K213_9PEZI|nr:ricin B-like lectin [Choiromyces venosus 120613-1]